MCMHLILLLGQYTTFQDFILFFQMPLRLNHIHSLENHACPPIMGEQFSVKTKINGTPLPPSTQHVINCLKLYCTKPKIFGASWRLLVLIIIEKAGWKRAGTESVLKVPIPINSIFSVKLCKSKSVKREKYLSSWRTLSFTPD